MRPYIVCEIVSIATSLHSGLAPERHPLPNRALDSRAHLHAVKGLRSSSQIWSQNSYIRPYIIHEIVPIATSLDLESVRERSH